MSTNNQDSNNSLIPNHYSDPAAAIEASKNTESNPFDIFSNPQIQRAKESLPPQMRAQYEQLGESIWNQMETSQMAITNNTGEEVNFTGESMPPPVEEAAAHITDALKSGMHPSLLEEEEKNVMKECFGSTWWRKWNYKDEEMDQTI